VIVVRESGVRRLEPFSEVHARMVSRARSADKLARRCEWRPSHLPR
jgi:hypothetical protein